MSSSDYYARVKEAGDDASKADRLLDSLRLGLGLVRKYGSGSLKLYGAAESCIVFQPALARKATPGLRVQTPPDLAPSLATALRARVKEVGGSPQLRFNVIPTTVLVERWDEVNRVLLTPFLKTGH